MCKAHISKYCTQYNKKKHKSVRCSTQEMTTLTTAQQQQCAVRHCCITTYAIHVADYCQCQRTDMTTD